MHKKHKNGSSLNLFVPFVRFVVKMHSKLRTHIPTKWDAVPPYKPVARVYPRETASHKNSAIRVVFYGEDTV